MIIIIFQDLKPTVSIKTYKGFTFAKNRDYANFWPKVQSGYPLNQRLNNQNKSKALPETVAASPSQTKMGMPHKRGPKSIKWGASPKANAAVTSATQSRAAALSRESLSCSI